MGLVQKAFSDIITFSRSSNATRVGPTGLVEYAPHNLLTYSEDFSNVAWSVARATITANSLTAPNGTVTADSLVEDTTNNSHVVYRTVASFSIQPYTVSVYLKAASRTKARIALASTAFPASPYLDIDLSAVTVTGANGATGSITSVGNGWYRCAATVTASASGNGDVYFQPRNDAGSASYTGNGLTALYLWGAQLSVGPYPLDYTPTTSAAVYGPRFDYDPVTLAARGLLVEEQRTNLLTYSEQFDNAAWAKSSTTVSANAVVAPDGQTTADKLIETAATTNHYISQAKSATNGVAYTTSLFLKAAERRYAIVDMSDGVTGGVYVYVDLQTGTFSQSVVAGGSWTNASASISSFGNGWYRVSVTGTLGAGSTAIPLISVSNAATGGEIISYAGDGTSGIYLWGAQLEAGSFATSLIPTLASTVTRSADVASVNTLSPWFNATEGTLYAEGGGRGTNVRLAGISDGSSANRLIIYLSSSTTIKSLITTSSAEQYVSSDLSVTSTASSNKAATAYALNNVNTAVNGTIGTLDTSATIPTVTILRIGSNEDATSAFLNGHLRRIAYYPRRLTDAELAALTA